MSDNNSNGCLINILSLLAGFLGLVLGVTLQVLIFGEGGKDEIGAGMVVAITFGAYYLAKKKLKEYYKE